jgi:hypothetical protein
MPKADEAIDQLIGSRPRLHRTDSDWGLGSDALRWLADRVQPDWRTIETGVGLSSIIFTLRGATHTIVAPAAWEHEAVRAWCEERGFSTDKVTSVVDHSQQALPGLPSGPFDLALVDGGHGFPVPFIDWYYLSERLRVGGWILIDDRHLRTGRILCEFLAAETERWLAAPSLENTAVFRKTSDVVIPDTDWVGQPWSVEPAREDPPSSTRPLASFRAAVRPRTRLRGLARRLSARR